MAYKCEVCGKSEDRLANAIVHIGTHSSQERYETEVRLEVERKEKK
jgi:hypothetical protein